MHFSATLGFAAALATTANAQLRGFNYGALFTNQAAKFQADFAYEFNVAKNLPGVGGFTAARLYTMVQGYTTNDVLQAIPAAIDTRTQLLLGLWGSAGSASFDNEITALKKAIDQYGTSFTDLVVGISVGSEDLYRSSETGQANGAGPGASPDEMISYIRRTRDAIANTPLAGKPVGHVDTWTAWVDGRNNGVIANVDFLGMDGYPYFQTEMPDNSIGVANQSFYDSLTATRNAAQGKAVWVTETGWPVSGPTLHQAVPSAENARIYWEDVSCSLIRSGVNFFYYMLQESQWGQAATDFGIMPAGDLGQVRPSFDLSCPGA